MCRQAAIYSLTATLLAGANFAAAQAQDAGPSGELDELLAPEPTPAPLDVIPVEADDAPADTLLKRRRQQPMLEEIVVTAQRREESLQDVPISITVFDQKQITNANITNASDLATYTPSLSTNNRLGGENATFTLRGFTQVMRTTATVATYFAEVVAPRGQSVQNSGDGAGPGALFDLQNVQVLKGPQGTLFGRNTTGGAVVIVPQKPTDAFGGYAEVSAGDYGMLRQQAVLNLPVSERLRLRLGVDNNRREGHLHNITGIGADNLGNVDYTAARISALFDVTETLENYTILSYVDSHNNGYTSQLYACNPSPLPTENTLFLVYGAACRNQLAEQAANGQDGYYDLVSTVDRPITTIEELRLINTTTWDLADEIRLKGILAYAHLVTENESDIFGTSFRAPWDVSPDRELKNGLALSNPDFPVTSQETWIGELQLQGQPLDSRLQWQGGVYFENSLPDGDSGMNSASLVSCETATLNGPPSGFNCFDPLLGQIGSVRSTALKTEYLNQALYAQATFNILESLSVTGGLRYTWDITEGSGVKTYHAFAATVPLPPRVVTTTARSESKAPTGLLELSYRPFDGAMAYARYARGYRQGSINMAVDPGIDTFEPEKVDTYEVGAKFSFGGFVPGRFNMAAFYNDFTDMQLETGFVSQTSGTSTAIFNAGKSRIQGIEFDAYLQPFDSLGIGVSYSYLDTILLEQLDRRVDVLAATGVLAALTYTPIAEVGETLPFAPEHTAVTWLNWRLPLPDRLGTMELGATYVYTGERRSTSSSASPFAVLRPFELLNLNLSWQALFGTPIDAALFATNVLDEQYMTFTTGTYASLGYESRQTGMPRMIGARLKYNF